MTLPIDFQTTAHGKWILAGEHAVLRGSPAIIFPLYEKAMMLTYTANTNLLNITINDRHDSRMEVTFRQALQRAAELADIPFTAIQGHFSISNTIPVSAGLGASAALCVAIGRWFLWKKWIKEENLYEFSRQIENLFHQESSGADIAITLSNSGILFYRNNGYQPININWQPHWYLSYCNTTANTAECVKQVKSLFESNPELARQLDEKMQDSVQLSLQALQSSEQIGRPLLANAINQAQTCFKQWKLINSDMQEHINQLSAAGALAVKPTGSGGGGFLLSLWEQPAPEMPFKMIKLTISSS